MIENVKITGHNQILEMDRTKTPDYVLDTVDFGERDTQYSLVNTIGLIGLERDIWFKRLSAVVITGWVIRNDRDVTSLQRCKRRLNHFVIPNRQYTIQCDSADIIQFLATESIRYGTSESDNNEAFCKFQITGVRIEEQ